MIEPPIRSDDTQPTVPLRQQRTAIWPLLLILVTLGTLGMTAVWWASEHIEPPSVATINPMTIEIDDAGQRTTVYTTAQTIGDLLEEAHISLEPDDAISDPLDAPLRPGRIIYINRAREINLTVDGEHQTIRSALTNPYDILQQAGVRLADVDRVWLDGTETDPGNVLLWPVPVLDIEVKHAMTVTVVDSGETRTLETTAETIGEALFEADITLYLTDIVTPDLTQPVSDGLTVSIDRADPITVVVDGAEIETRVQGTTVSEALAEAGISLIGLDYTRPEEAAPTEPGMRIEVIRVTEERETSTEPIGYDTVYTADAAMALDTQELRQGGQAGVREIYTRVRYENGVEVSRSEDGSAVMQEPVNEVIAYGTNIVLHTIDTPEGPVEYWRTFRVYATSYHPAALGGDDVTAIGMKLQKGVIGANPNLIPYRTNVYVPGYGTGVIADTGGARSSPYWIDLGYSDEDWVSWSRYVDIYLLTPVPADIDYVLPTWTPMRGH
ncbi:MAG: DUF348 domain-containing protein [Anaerolineaceae bacterium]|nr:DUF348 domain-containing protein [Anaerolineaceae bacterium]